MMANENKKLVCIPSYVVERWSIALTSVVFLAKFPQLAVANWCRVLAIPTCSVFSRASTAGRGGRPCQFPAVLSPQGGHTYTSEGERSENVGRRGKGKVASGRSLFTWRGGGGQVARLARLSRPASNRIQHPLVNILALLEAWCSTPHHAAPPWTVLHGSCGSTHVPNPFLPPFYFSICIGHFTSISAVNTALFAQQCLLGSLIPHLVCLLHMCD